MPAKSAAIHQIRQLAGAHPNPALYALAVVVIAINASASAAAAAPVQLEGG